MFWHYLFYSLIILFGLFILFRPNLFVEITKNSKRVLDEAEKKRLGYLLQVLGGFIVIASFILMFELI